MWRTTLQAHNDPLTKRHHPHTCLHQHGLSCHYLVTGTPANTHQLPSTCANSIKIQWLCVENRTSALLSKSLAESNKGWEEDAPVQGLEEGSKTIKSRTVRKWNTLQTYYWGERKTTSHNCLGDGKPFRLPGKDDQRRGKKRHSDDCVQEGEKSVKGDAARPLTSGQQTWSWLSLWLYLFQRAMKMWTRSPLTAM